MPIEPVAAHPIADEGTGALLPVAGDLAALIELFADATAVSMSHWNPVTGETFQLPAGPRRRAAAQAFELRLLAQAEQDGLGWVEVPFQESDAAHAQAREFVSGLVAGRGRATLLRALAAEKPFRAYRAALRTMPSLARRWQLSVLAEAERRLVDFCLANGWSLADDRFAASLERWLDATEHEPQGPVAPKRSALRAVAALSIGRAASARTPNA